MKVIYFVKAKEGVGKTTLSILTSVGLSKLGYKTLLIDTDHIDNSSYYVLGEKFLRSQWKVQKVTV